MLHESYYALFEQVDFRKPITHIVSIGGGLSSTIELPLEVIRKYGAENVELVICALAGEHDDLWHMVDECERLTGLKVTRITYHPYRKYLINPPQEMYWDIWDVFEQQGMMGNSLADPCSRILKRETMKHYITRNYHPAFTVLHVGITRDEIDRMMAIRANWGREGYKVEADLCDVNQVGTREERAMKLLNWIPTAYAQGHSHNNCGGMCVKAGHAQMARLLWYNPDVFYYHAEKERLFQLRHETQSTIMRDRKVIAGKSDSTPLSLYAFEQRMKSKWRGMLPGFSPFEDLEDTAGCKWCEAA